MSVKQIERLTEWLEAKGHTPQEMIECIRYIANPKLSVKGEKKKSGPDVPPKEPD